jgi:hypothetical protein
MLTEFSGKALTSFLEWEKCFVLLARQRPIGGLLLQYVSRGKQVGLLCWLSRNA